VLTWRRNREACEKTRYEALYAQHLRALKLQGKANATADSYARAVRRAAANANCADYFAAQTRWIKKDRQINAICGPAKQNTLATQSTKRKLDTQNRSTNLLASAIEPNRKQCATTALDNVRTAFCKNWQSIGLELQEESWRKMLYPIK